MSVVAKILIVINLLFAVAFLAASATFLGAKTHWKKEYEDYKVDAESKIETLINTKAQLTTDLNAQERKAETASARVAEKDRALSDLKANYDEVYKGFQGLTRSHNNLTTNYEQLEKDYNSKVTRIGELTDEVSKAVADKEEAIRRENAAVAEKQRLDGLLLQANQKISSMAQDMNATAMELNDTKLENKAFKDTVGEIGPLKAQESIDAMVTGVSGKVNLLILSAGRDDGVKKGYEFTIFRGGQYVGKAIVDRVEKDHCTAFSKKEVEKTPIKVGDKGTTRF